MFCRPVSAPSHPLSLALASWSSRAAGIAAAGWFCVGTLRPQTRRTVLAEPFSRRTALAENRSRAAAAPSLESSPLLRPCLPVAMAPSDLDLVVMDAPPQITRRRSAWSRCDEAVARLAPTATTTCQVCGDAIAQGLWQVGLMFIHVEGFMLMEWYHVACTTSVPGLVLDELLETVQSEMTPQHKLEFQAAVVKALADAPVRPSVSQ